MILFDFGYVRKDRESFLFGGKAPTRSSTSFQASQIQPRSCRVPKNRRLQRQILVSLKFHLQHLVPLVSGHCHIAWRSLYASSNRHNFEDFDRSRPFTPRLHMGPRLLPNKIIHPSRKPAGMNFKSLMRQSNFRGGLSRAAYFNHAKPTSRIRNRLSFDTPYHTRKAQKYPNDRIVERRTRSASGQGGTQALGLNERGSGVMLR